MPLNPPPPLHHHLATMPSSTISATILTGAVLLALVLGVMIVMRKFARQKSGEPDQGWASETPDTENASAFMTASMQGVIEKLRAQEKELARLHLLAQERAQESERLTEEVTRNMPTGLLLVNATGAISSTNPAAEEALGQRPLRYRSYKEILGADSDLAQMLSACLKDGKTIQRGEVEHLTRDGDVRRLGVTISPIYRSAAGLAGRSASKFGPAGNTLRARVDVTASESSNATGLAAGASEMKISGALCLMSDLTQLTALQKQIRWKENLAALGEMSAGIAHEFKNALATISGYAQMIRNESQPGDTRDSAERILDQTRALTHVVTEFLRFAKPLEICYETVPMQMLVERVAQEVQEAIPQCTVTCEGRFVDLPGDEALIRQALVNLTRNAAEAARGGGKAAKVHISGSLEDLGGRKWQRLCVADNGPGIPEHDLPKIFLPFYTTKSEGTGLGLAVVQKVALQHGGSIEARNVAGVGAEFLLWLPLRQEPSPSLFPSQAARI
jgi:PAS domain S-box-containing protein